MKFIDLSPIGIQLVIAQAQRNLPLFAIDLDDLRRHVIQRLELLFHANVSVQSGFADVNQTFDVAFQFDEEPEVGDLADLAGDAIADLVPVRDLLFPRIAGQLLVAQARAAPFPCRSASPPHRPSAPS